MTGEHWSERRRPRHMRRYETIPLGIYGITDQPNYDWSWWAEGYVPGGGME